MLAGAGSKGLLSHLLCCLVTLHTQQLHELVLLRVQECSHRLKAASRSCATTANCTIIGHFSAFESGLVAPFLTLRDKNGWVRAKTARNLNISVSRNRFCDFLADPDSRSFSRFGAIIMQFAVVASLVVPATVRSTMTRVNSQQPAASSQQPAASSQQPVASS